jgi:hypothetical protein
MALYSADTGASPFISEGGFVFCGARRIFSL